MVFDLGGVIVQLPESWAAAHTAAGLPDDDRLGEAAFLDRLRAAARDLERGAIGFTEWCDRFAVSSGGLYTAEQVGLVLDAGILCEYDGISEVFDALEAAGVKTAVLSNTNERHWPRLAGLGGDELEYPSIARATFRLASFELRLAKPEPRISRTVTGIAGVSPGDVLFFDDIEANVEGARAAGWKAVRIDPLSPTAPQIMAALAEYGVVASETGRASRKPAG